ncbi:hypothetical protein BDV96DRAFT_654053 [Lophiotrema nucula]|uniref:NB-ARC domain-containing protein n=1 Tax=Lophiotrema nucula TaxID=690887 RepID=A0A6A5YJC7_9PLEO|nr:hypothetical protein BDV96DRAFT_654053 [Lophiotrema nucula]
MDPLSAIALTGNVLLFAELTAKIAKRLHEYQQRQGEVPKVFQGISTRLPLLIDILKQYDGQLVPEQKQKDVEKVTSSCKTQILNLQKILDETLPADGDSWATVKKKALLSILREKEVNRIDGELRHCAQLLTLHSVVPRGLTPQPANVAQVPAVTPVVKQETFFEVPNRRVSRFVGREKIIEDIERKFQSSPVVVLQGMGGQGKTQIALEFCHGSRSRGTYTGIFWIDATSEMKLRGSFEAISDVIKDPKQVFATADEKVQFVRQKLKDSGESWLMVFDNHDEPERFGNVTNYLPINTKNAHVLFTTRHADVGRYGDTIALRGMTENEALDLFFHRSAYDPTSENIQEARSIVERLGYHPLALDQAAAYLSKRRTTLPLNAFIEHYKKRRKEIWRTTPKVWEYQRALDGSAQEISLSVFTTWELSCQQLFEHELGNEYTSLLCVMAYFHHESIEESLFSTYMAKRTRSSWLSIFVENGIWQQDRYEDAIVELRDLALVESYGRNTDGLLYVSLHPLVKDWIQIRTTDQQRYECAILQQQILKETLRKANYAWVKITTRQAVRSHVRVSEGSYQDFICPHLRATDLKFLARYYFWVSIFYREIEEYVEAERVLKICYELGLKVDGDDFSSELLNIRVEQGNLAFLQHRLQEAEEILHEVETIRVESNMEVTGSWIHDRISYADVLNDLLRSNEAEKLYRSTIEIASSELGLRHEVVLRALSNLALFLLRRCKFVEAEEIYRDLIDYSVSEHGAEHEETTFYCLRLGTVFHHMGRYKEARDIFLESVNTRHKNLEPDHPSTIEAVHRLGMVQTALGFFAKAETMLQANLASSEKLFGTHHVETLGHLHTLSRVWRNIGKVDESIEAGHRVLLRHTELFGPNHLDALLIRLDLAGALLAKGSLNEAEGLVREGLERCNPDEPAIARVHYELRCKLAEIYDAEDRLEAARDIYQIDMSQYQELIGAGHPDILEASVHYAFVLERLNEEEEARRLLLEAKAGLEVALESEHPIHKTIAEALSRIGDAERTDVSEST